MQQQSEPNQPATRPNPRTERVGEEFSQDWEIFAVLTSPLKLATYVELATVCNVEDLYNMLEIIEAKEEFEEVARINAEANRPLGD